MKSTSRVLAVVGVVLAVAAAGGCGGKKANTTAAAGGKSSSPGVSTPTAGAPEPTPSATVRSGGGGCGLVSRDEAAKVLGVAAVQPGTEQQATIGPVKGLFCQYFASTSHGPPALLFGAFDLGSGGQALFKKYKTEQCTSASDCQDVSGIGDEAYFDGDSLVVRAGNRGVVVGALLQPEDKKAALEADKRVAATVLSRL